MTDEEWYDQQQQEWKENYCSMYYCPAANYEFDYEYHNNPENRIRCTGQYPKRHPLEPLNWNDPVQIDLNFGTNPVIFNRLFVKMKTSFTGSNIRLKKGKSSMFECEVINEKTENEELIQLLKCGVKVINHYPTFENIQAGYQIEVPKGLVTDPETDIIVIPKLFSDFEDKHCGCEFGTAVTGKICNYYGQSVRNNMCSECDVSYLLDGKICVCDSSTHFLDDSGACLLKRCTCEMEGKIGAKGAQCPNHGDELCIDREFGCKCTDSTDCNIDEELNAAGITDLGPDVPEFHGYNHWGSSKRSENGITCQMNGNRNSASCIGDDGWTNGICPCEWWQGGLGCSNQLYNNHEYIRYHSHEQLSNIYLLNTNYSLDVMGHSSQWPDGLASATVGQTFNSLRPRVVCAPGFGWWNTNSWMTKWSEIENECKIFLNDNNDHWVLMFQWNNCKDGNYKFGRWCGSRQVVSLIWVGDLVDQCKISCPTCDCSMSIRWETSDWHILLDKCNPGYHLQGWNVCLKNVCTCENGIPVVTGSTGTCETHASNQCHQCDAGYDLVNRNCIPKITCPEKHQHFDYSISECVDNVCTCSNGIPVDSASCLENGVNNCKQRRDLLPPMPLLPPLKMVKIP